MEWIPVSERLPEDGEIVDIFCFPTPTNYPQDIKNGRRAINCRVGTGDDGDGSQPYKIFYEKNNSVFYRDHEYIPENYQISHWMLCPKKPTKQQEWIPLPEQTTLKNN